MPYEFGARSAQESGLGIVVRWMEQSPIQHTFIYYNVADKATVTVCFKVVAFMLVACHVSIPLELCP